ncbi:MAG: 23S rRNA (adenine(2503)-C(2))-methyltransferase RlmN [Verrucomicrobiaceae bacterium]|nr:23S rRNA (adenine(2503)-C(2))-methyltransferase RlmN [Verrucomicrobiaceae bacterium]
MEPSPSLPSAFGLTLDDWIAWAESHGQTRFRAKQIVQWLYEKRVRSWEEMTNLSQALREQLARSFSLARLPVVRLTGSADTTRKFLFRLHDGRLVETVKIPANVHFDGGRSDRVTLCVSSQVGCAYACQFCASGLAGFTRNLEVDEIVGQVLAAEEEAGDTVCNIVFMGMGEPLANLTRLTKAIEILNAPWGLNIGARHMTVSTSGLAPQIEKLALVPLQIRLAVSLHGATDEVRDRIMPVNKKYPLARLFESLETWRDHKKQKITFEYILIEGLNDHPDQAKFLAKRARAMEAKVNLIPYNTVEGFDWKRPSEARQEAFLAVLKKAGVTATLRREKGHDIDAACGQLRLQEETAAGIVSVAGKG